MTVSVLTNTTFGFAQTIDADFCRQYPGILTSEFRKNPIMPMYLVICSRSGADFNHRKHPDDVYNYDMQHIGEFFYVPVYTILESFSRVLKPGRIPLAKKGFLAYKILSLIGGQCHIAKRLRKIREYCFLFHFMERVSRISIELMLYFHNS